MQLDNDRHASSSRGAQAHTYSAMQGWVCRTLLSARVEESLCDPSGCGLVSVCCFVGEFVLNSSAQER